MKKKNTMLDYIELTPSKVLENIKNPQELTKTLTDEYIANNYNEICIVASVQVSILHTALNHLWKTS